MIYRIGSISMNSATPLVLIFHIMIWMFVLTYLAFAPNLCIRFSLGNGNLSFVSK